MSTLQLRGNNVFRFPNFLRRRRRITDGDLELRVTYELYQILVAIPPSSRERALKHVREIFHEQAEALGDYQFED